MDSIQKVKISFNSSDVYFIDHAFDSAYDQAESFIERNKGKFDMTLYYRNNASTGGLWLFQGIY